MRVAAVTRKRLISSAQGAVFAALCGLVLWIAPLGDSWVNASYDYLFRFGARSVTNNVAVILMDNESYDYYNQTRGQPWDRSLHTQLLNKLADDGCSLVVMDCFFREPRDQTQDRALAAAMRRQHHIALMAEQAQVTYSTMLGMRPLRPAEPFYSAAATNWGVAWLDPDSDLVVRRHWPFPAPGPYPSLAQTAARSEGAQLGQTSHEQWLRYYGRNGAWAKLSYRVALTQPPNFFRNKIVFIGNEPKATIKDGEPDKFCTPYTRWTGETTGGVEIIVASFLNLLNNEWLRRPGRSWEVFILVLAGVSLGGGLCRMRPLAASGCAAAAAVIVTIAAVLCSYFTNYWFPWLVVACGQVPCALVWALVVSKTSRSSPAFIRTSDVQAQPGQAGQLPDIPGYELVPPHFGEGAYGKVWLARNNTGQWRAVKVVYLANFKNSIAPYEREFNGITRYQSISDKHPTLLRVDFVSEKLPGYFYYVMELGDSAEPGWEREPTTYRPRDLARERAGAPGGRVPLQACLAIGLELTDALDFLHQHGFTHRDIKPQNIIFIDGRPKLADLGLIAEIRPFDQKRTLVGTPGYMPPPPEIPGTPQADIYALGMMLYVLSTGRDPAFFPEISTTLAETIDSMEFFTLNSIVLKACQPDPAQRYASALEMHQALQVAKKIIANARTRKTSPAQ
jgi:CHASE2 domain-containing sensor protein